MPNWSAVAIVGFIVSFLLVLAPLGILLGIVGIFRTSGGRRRGMGLSVAAIPIGLIVGSLSWVLVLFGVVFVATFNAAREATDILSISRVEVPQKAGEFYEQSSDRFQQAVSREQFEQWLTQVIATHGTLQSFKQGTQPFEPTPAGEWRFNFTGQFVNGAANIAVTLDSADGVNPQVVDMSVDGLSAIPTVKPPDSP